MNEPFMIHDSFYVERHYNAAPQRVFAAWSDPAVKSNWFPKSEEFDFRVGGREVVRMEDEEGAVYQSIAVFQEIVPDRRMVYSFTIDKDDKRISVCTISVEFKPDADGTKLVYTELCAFLDGLDSVEIHRPGSEDFLNKLEIELSRAV